MLIKLIGKLRYFQKKNHFKVNLLLFGVPACGVMFSYSWWIQNIFEKKTTK